MAVGPPGAAQAPLDRQALIGEWVGKWTATIGPGGGRHGGPQGPYSLTVNGVEGDRVFATVAFQGTRNVRATLSGNNLTFGNEQFKTVLSVDGDQMRGAVTGGGVPPREIALIKKK
ncbi:MAG: hypothetical protein ACREKS_22085 [Candidatus Rokuibacteriota bacterium]